MFPRLSGATERTFHESSSASGTGAVASHAHAELPSGDAGLFDRLAYAANASGARLDSALGELRDFSAWLAQNGQPSVTALLHEPEIAGRLIERFNNGGGARTTPSTPPRSPLPFGHEHDVLAVALFRPVPRCRSGTNMTCWPSPCSAPFPAAVRART